MASGELPSLLIFPEGTTTNAKYVVNFKRGAFESMCPVKLLTLKYECQGFDMAMDEMGQFCHVLLVLCHSPRMTMTILHDVKPQGVTPDEFMRYAREKMAAMMKVPLLDTKFRDKQEF